MPFLTDFSYASSSGQNELHTAICTPEGPPCGVVQIVHGLAEHIGRYSDFMLFLAENGYVSVGNDHLGHGLSAKDSTELGFFAEHNGWNCVVQDTQTLRDMMQARYPDIPYFIFGHSMGSFIVRNCLISNTDFCSGAVLSGTAHPFSVLLQSSTAVEKIFSRIGRNKMDYQSLFSQALKKCLERIDNPRTEYDWISRDPEQVDAFLSDAKCAFPARKELFLDLLHGLSLITDPDQIVRMNKSTPVLFLSGKEDPVGEYGNGVTRAYDSFCRAGMCNVTLRLYPGGRHEMLHELNRFDVEADVLSWIKQFTS